MDWKLDKEENGRKSFGNGWKPQTERAVAGEMNQETEIDAGKVTTERLEVRADNRQGSDKG